MLLHLVELVGAQNFQVGARAVWKSEKVRLKMTASQAWMVASLLFADAYSQIEWGQLDKLHRIEYYFAQELLSW